MKEAFINKYIILILCVVVMASCGRRITPTSGDRVQKYAFGTKPPSRVEPESVSSYHNPKGKYFVYPIEINRQRFVLQAKKYLGVRYKYGGNSVNEGLDCSGFVHKVFSDFDVKSPRVSHLYTDEGQTITLEAAREGDIILFTGSNHRSGKVGHLGIIVRSYPDIQFIHSASGKNIGVIISDFKGYYVDHFVKIIRVLK